MTTQVQGRTDAIANVQRQFSSGEFLQTLGRRVAYQTESQSTGRESELRAYLEREMRPAFAELDFESRLVESPSGKSPFLVAEHRESDALPTVLIYGHGDVVDGMIGDPDPIAAIHDAINLNNFDEVIISTLSAPLSRWLKLDLPSKVSGMGLPVTTVTPAHH